MARNVAAKLSGLSILDALDEPGLLGGSIRDPESWKPWRAFLAAIFSLGMETTPVPSSSANARGARSFRQRFSSLSGSASAGGAGKAS